jgi:hypothetical protein
MVTNHCASASPGDVGSASTGGAAASDAPAGDAAAAGASNGENPDGVYTAESRGRSLTDTSRAARPGRSAAAGEINHAPGLALLFASRLLYSCVAVRRWAFGVGGWGLGVEIEIVIEIDCVSVESGVLIAGLSI